MLSSRKTTSIYERTIATYGATANHAPGTDGVEIKPTVNPVGGEPFIVKHHINAFHGTDLKQQRDAHGVEAVVIVGAMSHMGVDACVRAAVDTGYPATVLHDACATRDVKFNGVTVPAAHVHATMMAAFESATEP